MYRTCPRDSNFNSKRHFLSLLNSRRFLSTTGGYASSAVLHRICWQSTPPWKLPQLEQTRNFQTACDTPATKSMPPGVKRNTDCNRSAVSERTHSPTAGLEMKKIFSPSTVFQPSFNVLMSYFCSNVNHKRHANTQQHIKIRY